ncbi:MAG: ABC transporter permease [bacterium]|nr:ABC transporter permease [bacterium]
MAVYERSYKRYAGDLSPQWSRFSVLPRYVYQDIFRSKFFLAFLILSLIYPLVCGAVIYLRHNAEVLEAIDVRIAEIFAIDASFFSQLMFVQIWFAFFVALFIGPGLVSKDLANNGLPLYLSRPFSRAEYVMGKFSVLAILLSLITWVPGLVLYALQSGYAGLSWATSNARIALTIFLGSWVWITVVSLMALALSAWVKWRPVAGFLMFMILLGGGFFQVIVNGLFRTEWGDLANLMRDVWIIWLGLIGEPGPGTPVWAAWLAVLAFVCLCIYMLNRKIRAYEVVS